MTNDFSALSIYLAGFDVFYPNSMEHGQQLKAICQRYGFEGMYPMDNAIEAANRSKTEIAADIFQQNIKLIDRANIIVANLNFFRGAEPDSGTSFELGYGYAKGKKLYGYVNDERTLLEKAHSEFGAVKFLADGTVIDKLGFKVENFGLTVNLMLGIPTTIVVGSFEDCIRRVHQELNLKQSYLSQGCSSSF